EGIASHLSPARRKKSMNAFDPNSLGPSREESAATPDGILQRSEPRKLTPALADLASLHTKPLPLPIVITLEGDLRIRSFTPYASFQYHLRPEDVGRRIDEIPLPLAEMALAYRRERASEGRTREATHPAASATILRTRDGRQYVRLVRDHRSHAAVFVEVTDLDRVAFLELTRSIDQISMAAQEGLANASERRGRRAPAEWTRTASRRSSPSRKTELVPKARP